MLIDIIHTVISLNKIKGGLFADSGNARNVVAGVAHKCLDFDKFKGFNTVFFMHGGNIHHGGNRRTHFCGSKADGGMLADKLKAVPVPGGNNALRSFFLANSGNGSEDIVRFPAFDCNNRVTQISQKLFHNRELVDKFLWGRVSSGFIFFIKFMAKSGRMNVKSKNNSIRFCFGNCGEQNRKKTVNRVGKKTVFCGKNLDSVKSAVHNAVGIHSKNFHGRNLPKI